MSVLEGLRAGDVVAEKYRLTTPLGEGGMGVVWAAEHLVTRRPVALKLLRDLPSRGRRDPRRAERMRERALREARASVAVEDPRVLPIDDVLEHEGRTVLVMARLHGETLRARLDRETKIPAGDALPLLVDLAGAIAAAHAKGVVHRDLKPDNVFLLATPVEGSVVRLLDLGIAKLAKDVLGDDMDTPLTTTGAMLGTPYYMSPEQGFGETDLDARSDAWSFGVLAYEVLAGVRPVRGDNLGQVLKAIAQGARPPLEGATSGVPRAVCHAIDALLVSDREARGSLARFVDACASTDAPEATHSPEGPRPVFGEARRRTGLALAAALFLAVGASGTMAARRLASAPAPTVQPEPRAAAAIVASPSETSPSPSASPSSSAPSLLSASPVASASTPARAPMPPPTTAGSTAPGPKSVVSAAPSAPVAPVGSVGRGPAGVVVTPPF
ncbi:MAG: protein kinase [Myxococcales bacterium]|nr:protein kinase [Myxococcales bacterium]